MALTGKCHCGAIRYSAEGAPKHHALCHCTDCRGCAGAPMVGWVAFAEDQVTIDGDPVGYRSSEHATREFCGTCGTGLFYRNPVMLPGIIDIQSATLDDAAGNAPGAQIMVKERLPWMEKLDTLPQFPGFPGSG